MSCVCESRIRRSRRRAARRGAIVPLFAVLLPVLLIFAGFAINLAYMQLVTTELKITTDCAAHAGGRAMSIAQSDNTLTNQEKRDKALADGVSLAKTIAQANPVVGRVLSVGDEGSGSEVEVGFGRSTRTDGGMGMYDYTEISSSDLASASNRPTSIRVLGTLDIPMMFNVMKNSAFDFTDAEGNTVSSPARHIDRFTPTRQSVATQVDRDIALVLDRSGSMLYYRDDEALSARLYELYTVPETIYVPGGWKYRYYRYSRGRWYDRGYWFPDEARSSWYVDTSDRYYQNGYTYESSRISSTEYNDATAYLYDRYYTNNVIYQLEKWENPDHNLGSSYSSSENYKLTSEMAKYTHDWKYTSEAPRYSRWWYLEQGVAAFFDVLDVTDQEELVSLVTFNSSATLDYSLQNTYDSIRNHIDTISPTGGTAIGDGMTTGLPPIVSGVAARPFAAKTIVVLTDGISNAGQDPDSAVADIMADNKVTIHTVTFTPGADKAAMRRVADAGYGRHYHADDGSALVQIFEEIANNLPTILTE